MKIDPTNDYCAWNWVAHPDGLSGYYRSDAEVAQMLVKRRYDIEIIGGVEDSYDDWALCKLDDAYYLLSTSGCSCPPPKETWDIEIGPATIAEIREHVVGDYYSGYTVPAKQKEEFLTLLSDEEFGGPRPADRE